MAIGVMGFNTRGFSKRHCEEQRGKARGATKQSLMAIYILRGIPFHPVPGKVCSNVTLLIYLQFTGISLSSAENFDSCQ
jgi:hypothetical protein